MIKKEVKEYKRGNSHTYRINIAKQDNLTGIVSILTVDEYETLQNELKILKETINQQNHKVNQTIANKDNEIKELHIKIDTHENNNKAIRESNEKLREKIYFLGMEHEHFDKRNDKLIKENTELLRENKYLKKELNNIKDTTIKFNTLITDLQKQQDETIKELNKQQDKIIENINMKHQDQLKQIYEKFNKDLTKYITVNQLQNTALKQILELGFIDLIRNKHKKIAKDQIKELDNKPVYELTKKE